MLSLLCTCSHVAKQSLSKQDTSISVVSWLCRLSACSKARVQVSAAFHFLFLYVSPFRIAVICLVVCKEGKPQILLTREEARSLQSTVSAGLAKPHVLDFLLGESMESVRGCGACHPALNPGSSGLLFSQLKMEVTIAPVSLSVCVFS